MRKLLKFMHTLGSIGFAGGLGCFMLALSFGPSVSELAAYAALRQLMADVSGWVIVPSMGIILASGLFAMSVHYPFQEARWVWVKAVSGIIIFKTTFFSLDAAASDAAAAARSALEGELSVAELAATVDDQWVAWWMLLLLAVLNVVFAVWRPHLRRSKARA